MQTANAEAAIQANTAVVMSLHQAVGVSMANTGEAHLSEHCGQALRQPGLNWKVSDKYIELLNFEMEIMNTLQTRASEVNNDEKVCIIKNWLGREGLQFI